MCFRRFFRFFLVVSLFFPSFLWAQSTLFPARIIDGIAHPAFEMERKNGLHLQPQANSLDSDRGSLGMTPFPLIVFPEGRIAHLVRRDITIAFARKMVITNSSCGKILAPACRVTTHWRQVVYELVWKAHPDPSKVGQALLQGANHGKVFSESTILEAFSKDRFPRSSRGLDLPVLTCEDFSWLGGKKKDAVHLLDWTIESMVRNLETSLALNRTIETALSIDLLPVDGGYRIQHPKHYSGASLPDFGLVFIDNMGWTVDREKFESCDITASLSQLDEELGKIYVKELADFVKNPQREAFEGEEVIREIYLNFSERRKMNENGGKIKVWNFLTEEDRLLVFLQLMNVTTTDEGPEKLRLILDTTRKVH